MPHSWHLTCWIPFSAEQIYLPLFIYVAIWKFLKLFIVTTDVSIFLQLLSTLIVIIINAFFIFIVIIFVTINTIIVMLIFTFKVYFLKFSYVSVVCVNSPDRFLKDYNRNKVFLHYLCSRTSFRIYLTLPLIFSYSIILEKFLNFFWLDTILCNGGRY